MCKYIISHLQGLIYNPYLLPQDCRVPPTAAACVSTAESEPVNEMKAGNVVEIIGLGPYLYRKVTHSHILETIGP